MATKKGIKYVSDTEAQVTKAFEKKACIFGTDEFQEWRAYKAIFPKAQMITKTIKKSETQKKRRNRTYENMEAYIDTLVDEADTPPAKRCIVNIRSGRKRNARHRRKKIILSFPPSILRRM